MLRKKTAKELLADSFRELAERTGVHRITVKAIADNCGYSLATFYRCFRDKHDLIAWDYARQVSEIVAPVGTGSVPWRQTLLEGARYYESNREYLSNLFLNTAGLDAFLFRMTETNYTCLKACLQQIAGTDTLDTRTDMCLRLYCHGTVALACEWVLGRYLVTAEELAEIFERSLPEPLRPYLLNEQEGRKPICKAWS